MVLGLIPDCALDEVRAVGNAAGGGAARLLLSLDERDRIEQIVQNVEKIELLPSRDFRNSSWKRWPFLKATAATPNLAKAVELPISQRLHQAAEVLRLTGERISPVASRRSGGRSARRAMRGTAFRLESLFWNGNSNQSRCSMKKASSK